MSEEDKRRGEGPPSAPAGEKKPDLQSLQSRLAALRSGLARPVAEKQHEKEPPTVVQTTPPMMDPTPLPAPIVDESSLGVPMIRRPGATGPQPPPPGPRKTMLGIPPIVAPAEPARLPGIDPPNAPRRLETISLPGTPKTPPSEDEASTQRVERFDASDILNSLDTTPPPLPPSPATDAAEAFFEDVPTRPAAVTDLASTLDHTRPSGHVLIPKLSTAPPILEEGAEPMRPPGVAKGVVALGIAAAFAVGLTLGALLFRSAPTPPPPPSPTPEPAAAAASVPCTPPPAPVVVAASSPDAAPPPDAAATPTATADAACSLEVNSSPQGAEIFLDGKSVGHSPMKLESLACGTVSLRLSQPRYVEWKEKVELTPDQPGSVQAQLRRGLAKVLITSAPSGAKVYVGGRAVGQTPLTRDFPAYTRAKLQVVAPGYRPSVTYVYPKDKLTRVAVRLVKGR